MSAQNNKMMGKKIIAILRLKFLGLTGPMDLQFATLNLRMLGFFMIFVA